MSDLLAGRPPRRNHAHAEAKMSKKYQIFISSTFADLQNERSEILKAVLDLGHIPSGMELFPAADLNQMTYIKKIIDECDYYVLVIGARYGSTNDVGMSFTESEYRYAREKGKVILAFIHKKPDDLPAKYGERDPVITKRLEEFRNEVASGRLVRFWTSALELQSLVILALTHAMREAPGVGWVRGDAVASEELLRENIELRKSLDNEKARNDWLAKQLSPDVADLAGLDDVFQVSGWTSQYDGRSGRERRTSVGINMSWKAILAAVGPAISSPQYPTKISILLGKTITETGRLGDFELSDRAANQIKIHLVAAKLIRLDFSGHGHVERIVLTDLGMRTLTEILAVRKNPAD
jgi:Domain of unknown function (DUF4062)